MFFVFRGVTYRAFVFFFQAEDGIRDFHVTGVQTCALPICQGRHRQPPPREGGSAPCWQTRSTTSSASTPTKTAIPSLWSARLVRPPRTGPCPPTRSVTCTAIGSPSSRRQGVGS